MSQRNQKVLNLQFVVVVVVVVVVVMNILIIKILNLLQKKKTTVMEQPIRHARLLFWKDAY